MCLEQEKAWFSSPIDWVYQFAYYASIVNKTNFIKISGKNVHGFIFDLFLICQTFFKSYILEYPLFITNVKVVTKSYLPRRRGEF